MDSSCPEYPVVQHTGTKSDEYGDFKIGMIYNPNQEPFKITPSSRWFLKIDHKCNQYGMKQTKCIVLPKLDPKRLHQDTWESTTTVILLLQGDEEVQKQNPNLGPKNKINFPLKTCILGVWIAMNMNLKNSGLWEQKE